MNPRYEIWLEKTGGELPIHEFQIWIMENLRNFCKLHSLPEINTFQYVEQEKFTEYLRGVK